MSGDDRSRRRLPSGPPVGGWAFGAGDVPRAFWGGLAAILAIVAILLLLSSYMGYGVMLAILAAAAAVNLTS